jgi:hypothetical protein
MFGKLTTTYLLGGCKDEPPDSAVERLLAITDGAEIARWMQFPTALWLFVLVPGDPESGAFYLLDRKSGCWYWVDFEDDKYGGYSLADFDCLMKNCHFARLVEQPRLLGTCRWEVRPGVGPELLGPMPRVRSGHGRFNLTRRELSA